MARRILILSGILVTLAACGERSAETPIAAMPADTDTNAEVVAEVTRESLARTPSADGAEVFFVTPTDGATVSNPISVEFGIRSMDVVKAGNAQPNSGHHHLLLDTSVPDLRLPIPADEHHIHFGDGSTATEITLQPGEHTLQMLLGDHLHIPHDPPLLSDPITITVE